MRIPDGEVIDECGLVGSGLGVERGSRGSLQSVKGHHADFFIVNVGSVPVTIEVFAQYDYVVWKSARWTGESTARTSVVIHGLWEVARDDGGFGP